MEAVGQVITRWFSDPVITIGNAGLLWAIRNHSVKVDDGIRQSLETLPPRALRNVRVEARITLTGVREMAMGFPVTNEEVDIDR
jgi:hypothetical protein